MCIANFIEQCICMGGNFNTNRGKTVAIAQTDRWKNT